MIFKKKRIAVAICAAIMTLSLWTPTFSMSAQAADDAFTAEQNRISQLSDKYKSLQSEQKQIQAKINQAKTDKDKQLAVKQQIGTQIDTTKAQIDVLGERITLLEDSITQKELEMTGKQGEIDSNYQLFLRRVNAMAKIPDANMLGVALGAQSYAQFVNRAEIMERLAEHDNKLIVELKQQKDQLAQLKATIEADKTDVEVDKQEMDVKNQELSARMAETQKQIQDIAMLEQQFLANKEALQAQMKKVQGEIDAIYAEIARRSTKQVYVGGQMSQPTPTLNQVTSYYGPRFNNTDFHTGIDFSGANAYGQSIVASNYGTVAFVNTAVTPGYGYGKYVIIDHGGGITTLYGHCSAILVSEGQEVTRGQAIAQVGSTGWSTGPHCHFEVRVNGKHQNPVPYLSGK